MFSIVACSAYFNSISYLYLYIHIYIHTYIYIPIYIYIHIYIYRYVLNSRAQGVFQLSIKPRFQHLLSIHKSQKRPTQVSKETYTSVNSTIKTRFQHLLSSDVLLMCC